MSYLSVVVLRATPTDMARVERDNSVLLDGILAAAEGRMIRHERFERTGYTMDVDEFTDGQAYEDFSAQARDLLRQYYDLLGVEPAETLWNRCEG
ncbi:hypothetical protein JCM18899A_31570 [Nocardioides sp. AN3]